jgi:molybdopterin synthase catalytic subunit
MSESESTVSSQVAGPNEHDWFALTDDPINVSELYDWAVQPHCGAVVLFSGTVRDHAEGRPGVSLLEYEAYESKVVERLAAIGAQARRTWPDLGRFAMIHRVGPMSVTESSVVVVASSPHRPLAFEAARFGIDTLKATVPIWKREHWDGGVDWGLAATEITEVTDAASNISVVENGPKPSASE